MSTIESPYITADEAAQYLRYSHQHLLRLARLRGPDRIPHRRVGGRLLFLRTELDDWLEAQTVPVRRRRKPTRTTSRRKKAAA